MPPLTLLTATQGIHKPGELPAIQGKAVLKKGDFETISRDATSFAKIGDLKIKERTGFNEAQTPEQKGEILHNLANGLKDKDRSPSVAKYWDRFKDRFKALAPVRWIQSEVKPLFCNTTSRSLKAEDPVRNEQTKNTRIEIDFIGTAESKKVDANGKPIQTSDFESKLILDIPDLRGRTWYKKLWDKLANGGGVSVEQKINKFMMDGYQQIRLRNLGIDHKAEQRFESQKSGFLKSMEPGKTPKLKDISANELNALKLHYAEGGKESTLIGKALEKLANPRSGVKVTQSEVKELASLLQTAEVKTIGMVAKVAGSGAFTEAQSAALASAIEAINAGRSLETLSDANRDQLKMLSIMVHSALGFSRVESEGLQTKANIENKTSDNLKELILGQVDEVLPDDVITAPWIFSPSACANQVKGLDSLEIKNQGKQKVIRQGIHIENQISELSQVKNGASSEILEAQRNQNDVAEAVATRREMFNYLAESKGAMYRFQGVLPFLADKNREEIRNNLFTVLKNAIEVSTGKQDDGNNLENYASAFLAGGAAIAVGAHGAILPAVGLGAITAYNLFQAGPSKDTLKFRQRLDGAVTAIYHAMVRGSEDAIFKANNIVAEEVADLKVKEFCDKKIGELAKQSDAVADLNPLPQQKALFDAIAGNKSGNRQENFERLRTSLEGKMKSLAVIKAEVTQLGKEIEAAPLKDGLGIHNRLTLEKDDIQLDPNVKEALVKANQQNIAQCEILGKSLGIVKDFYSKDGKLHKQVLDIETKIHGALTDNPFQGDPFKEIGEGIQKLRSEIIGNAGILTSEHADHLQYIVDKIDERAYEANNLRECAKRLAKGIASPEAEYLSGKLDSKDLFSLDARLKDTGAFGEDLEALKSGIDGLGKEGIQQFSIFTENTGSLKKLQDLAKDAASSREAWNDCFGTMLSMASEAKSPRGNNIHNLREDLVKQVKDFNDKSKSLIELSTKYAGITGTPPSDLSKQINDHHGNALRVGTATIIGLPPEARSQCSNSLSVLAGPLANTAIHTSISKHLAGKEDKQAALNELMAYLPVAGDPASFESGHTEEWKSKTTTDGALRFLSTLYPEGKDSFDEALEALGQICSSEVLSEVRGKLFAQRVDNAFTAASNNPGLKNIFATVSKNSTESLSMAEFKILATQVDTLVGFGLPENLKGKAPNLSGLLEKYTDQAQRSSISEDDMGFLLRFAEGLKTLQENPEATRRYQIKIATLDLLTNIDPESFQSLKDPTEVDPAKLKQVFEPKPKDIKQWEDFKGDFSRAEKSLGDIQGQFENESRSREYARNLFITNNGMVELLNISDPKQLEIRDNLLNAHQAFKTGDWGSLLQSSTLTNQAAQSKKEVLNKEIKKSKIDLELLKYTNTENLNYDSALKKIASRIEQEQSSADPARNWLAESRAGLISQLQPVSETVADWLAKYGVGPHRETPTDTVNRIFSKIDKPYLADQLDALDNYINADRTLIDLQPNLAKAKAEFQDFQTKRDGLLEDRQNLLFKNAVRSAILTYCHENSLDPKSLQINAHQKDVKAKLVSLGWDPDEYPIVNDLKTYFEEVKKPDFLDAWTKEAGKLKSDLRLIDDAIKSAFNGLNASLDQLNKEIKAALESRLSEITSESDVLAIKGGINLETACAHAANLNAGKVPGGKEIAEEAIQELAKRLQNSHPVKQGVIKDWATGLSKSIQSQETWREISVKVSSSMDAFHHEILETTSETQRNYHSLLAATRALEFDRIADRIITGHFDSTAAKANEAYQAIQAAKVNFNALTAKDSLPQNLITENNGDPRSWVHMYAKDAGLDSKTVAGHFEKMHPLEFLALFTEGQPLQKFFASARGQDKGALLSLTNYMQGLRDAFGQMGNALGNFELEKYTAAVNNAQEVLQNPQIPQVGIRGGNRLNSIGNILKEPANLKPLGKAWKTIQVPKEQLIIRSEKQFQDINKTANQKMQEAEEEGSVAANEEEDYDDDESGFQIDIQEVGGDLRLSGQAALEQIVRQDSFSSRRSQQLEQLLQNPPPVGSDAISIQQEAGKSNELENKKWSDNLKKLGPNPTVQNYLTTQGFKFTKTDGDGDCFYNSIKHTTGENDVLETRQVIHACVGDFLSTIPQDDVVLHNDLKTRYQSGRIIQNAAGSNDLNAYGEMSECPAVARLYNRPVVVLSRSQPDKQDIALNRRPIVYHPDGSQTDMSADMKIPNNAIVLVHSGGLHWDGAVPVK